MKNLNQRIKEANDAKTISNFCKFYPSVASWFNSEYFYSLMENGSVSLRATYRKGNFTFPTVEGLPFKDDCGAVEIEEIVSYLLAEGFEVEYKNGYQHEVSYLKINLN